MNKEIIYEDSNFTEILPVEMLVNIFGYIEGKKVAKVVSLVSKRWREIAELTLKSLFKDQFEESFLQNESTLQSWGKKYLDNLKVIKFAKQNYHKCASLYMKDFFYQDKEIKKPIELSPFNGSLLFIKTDNKLRKIGFELFKQKDASFVRYDIIIEDYPEEQRDYHLLAHCFPYYITYSKEKEKVFFYEKEAKEPTDEINLPNIKVSKLAISKTYLLVGSQQGNIQLFRHSQNKIEKIPLISKDFFPGSVDWIDCIETDNGVRILALSSDQFTCIDFDKSIRSIETFCLKNLKGLPFLIKDKIIWINQKNKVKALSLDNYKLTTKLTNIQFLSKVDKNYFITQDLNHKVVVRNHQFDKIDFYTVNQPIRAATYKAGLIAIGYLKKILIVENKEIKYQGSFNFSNIVNLSFNNFLILNIGMSKGETCSLMPFSRYQGNK